MERAEKLKNKGRLTPPFLKSKIMKIERWLYIITILVLALLLLGERCSRKVCPPCQSTVIVKTDTTYIPQPVQIIPGPVNVAKKEKPKKEGSKNIEWEFIPESEPDPGYVVPENSISIYNDTFKFKEDAGYAVVKDSVQGKILKRSFSYNIKAPTIIPVAKKKGALYAGFMLLGNPNDPVGYIGASGMWVPRNQRQAFTFGFGSFNNKAYLQAGILFKIK